MPKTILIIQRTQHRPGMQGGFVGKVQDFVGKNYALVGADR